MSDSIFGAAGSIFGAAELDPMLAAMNPSVPVYMNPKKKKSTKKALQAGAKSDAALAEQLRALRAEKKQLLASGDKTGALRLNAEIKKVKAKLRAIGRADLAADRPEDEAGELAPAGKGKRGKKKKIATGKNVRRADTLAKRIDLRNKFSIDAAKHWRKGALALAARDVIFAVNNGADLTRIKRKGKDYIDRTKHQAWEAFVDSSAAQYSSRRVASKSKKQVRRKAFRRLRQGIQQKNQERKQLTAEQVEVLSDVSADYTRAKLQGGQIQSFLSTHASQIKLLPPEQQADAKQDLAEQLTYEKIDQLIPEGPERDAFMEMSEEEQLAYIEQLVGGAQQQVDAATGGSQAVDVYAGVFGAPFGAEAADLQAVASAKAAQTAESAAAVLDALEAEKALNEASQVAQSIDTKSAEGFLGTPFGKIAAIGAAVGIYMALRRR